MVQAEQLKDTPILLQQTINVEEDKGLDINRENLHQP